MPSRIKSVKPYIKEVVDRLYEQVPAGVGSKGFINISRKEFRQLVEEGSHWCIRNGYAWEEDLELTEENGCIKGADADKISDKAVDRGFNQSGTFGSGNHYLEVQVARPENIFDQELAKAFGITIPNQVVVMFHCGSRGFGHQVATDYLQIFLKVEASAPSQERNFTLEHDELELLLFNFLQELIYYKDSEQLLLRAKQVEVEEKAGKYHLTAVTTGETLDPNRHEQRVDVKAVTLHRFKMKKKEEGWTAIVILDI